MSKKSVQVSARIHEWQNQLLKKQGLTAYDAIAFYCDAKFQDQKFLKTKARIVKDKLNQLKMDEIELEQQLEEIENKLHKIEVDDYNQKMSEHDLLLGQCVSTLDNLIKNKHIDLEHAKILPAFTDVVDHAAKKLGKNSLSFYNEVIGEYEKCFTGVFNISENVWSNQM